jgi:hypothetical protein
VTEVSSSSTFVNSTALKLLIANYHNNSNLLLLLHLFSFLYQKLRALDNNENAIGAISQDGSVVYLDEFMVNSLKVPSEYIEKEKAEQLQEIKRRIALFRRPVTAASAVAPSSNEKAEEKQEAS